MGICAFTLAFPRFEANDRSEPARRDERLNDPRRLRGLAHPLRIRLRAELRGHGPATASQLAQRTGQSTGSVSYHLRQLAAYGFVVDEPGLGHGRERYWRAAGQASNSMPSTSQSSSELSTSKRHPESHLRADDRAFETPGASSSELDWSVPRESCEWYFELTAERADELSRQLHELSVPYAVERGESSPEVPRVVVRFSLERQPKPTDLLASLEEAPGNTSPTQT